VKSQKTESNGDGKSIGKSSTITVGLVIGIVGAIVAQVWWAANINSSIGSFRDDLRDVKADVKSNSRDVVTIQSDIQLLKSSASLSKSTSDKLLEVSDRVGILQTHDGPELSSRLKEIESVARQLKEEFEIYKITEAKKTEKSERP
jgi:hypothetical protein